MLQLNRLIREVSDGGDIAPALDCRVAIIHSGALRAILMCATLGISRSAESRSRVNYE